MTIRILPASGADNYQGWSAPRSRSFPFRREEIMTIRILSGKRRRQLSGVESHELIVFAQHNRERSGTFSMAPQAAFTFCRLIQRSYSILLLRQNISRPEPPNTLALICVFAKMFAASRFPVIAEHIRGAAPRCRHRTYRVGAADISLLRGNYVCLWHYHICEVLC